MHAVIKALEAIGCVVSRTGSREICSPPPVDTDEDWLVYVDPAFGRQALELLNAFEFVREEPDPRWPSKGFGFYVNANVNLTITSTGDAWERHRAATHVAKRLNLLDKQDRIAVFQAVLYGKQYPEDTE